MLIKAVDAKSGEQVAMLGAEGILPAVNTGDILVDLDSKQYRVLQRAYIMVKQQPKDGILDGRQTVDIELQLAVCPIEMEAEYAKQD